MASSAGKPICGIIMPIGAMPPNYEAAHWVDVRKILNSAIESANFTPQIVSDSFESDVIQNRIIQNLYDNEIVVCDVSGLNPNVMFELGVRLTFNKPVIAVTDDFDSLPFDTKIIEHLKYPRDLHIHQTNEFIKRLSEKILNIHSKYSNNEYKTPLESLGAFEVFKPTKEEVSGERYIIDKLDELSSAVRRLERSDRRNRAIRNNLAHNEPAFVKRYRLHFEKPQDLDAGRMTELVKVPHLMKTTHDAGGPVSKLDFTLSEPSEQGTERALSKITEIFEDNEVTFERME